MNKRYGMFSLIPGLAMAVGILLGGDGWAEEPQGEILFQKNCAVCHGEKGNGDGSAARFLFPKPRDFTTGVFKVRSTPVGDPPTDHDLFHTITHGMPGSAMPSFLALPENERKELVEHVKKLTGVTEAPSQTYQPGPPPKSTPQLLAAGKKAYESMKCWECHGKKGGGDGPKVEDLRDDWGYPALPNNFTRGIFKGGSEVSDIFLRFTTGMDGTPMPSFEGVVKEQEKWALAYYVKSLAGTKVALQPSTGDIAVTRITGELPSNPQNNLWKSVKEVQIPLMTLWQRPKVIGSVSVRAVHNGTEIAIQVQWEDAEVASNFLRHQDFVDAAAVMFPVSSGPLPHFTMGEEGLPVNIWHWRIDRQMDVAAFVDIETVYSGMVADDYVFDKTRYPKSTDKPGHLPVTTASSHDPVFLTGRGAGNIFSTPRRSAVQDLNAEGFGTLTAQEDKDQDVSGEGIWDSGSWKVVFRRNLKSEHGADVQLDSGSVLPIAFAVWDGSQGDRDGQKAVTTWYTLRLSK